MTHNQSPWLGPSLRTRGSILTCRVGWVPRKPHQRGHVASVHLPNHDLLLWWGHAANVEGLRPAGARAHHGRQCHWAVLHLPGPVELLLQDGGPVGDRWFGHCEVAAHMECHDRTPQVSWMFAALCCGGQFKKECTDRIVNEDAALKCSEEPWGESFYHNNINNHSQCI